MEIVSLWILRPIWFWEADPHQSHDVFNRVGAAADDPGSYGLTPTATSAEAFGQVTLRPSNKTNPAPSHNRVMGQHCQQTTSELSPPLHLKVRAGIIQFWTTQTWWYWALGQDDKSTLSYCLCLERNSKLKITQRRSRIYYFLSSSRLSYISKNKM